MHPQRHALSRSAAQLLALILAAATVTACAVTLISSYDETTDKGITALQKSVDGLLSQLDRTPVPSYAAERQTYDAIRGDLNSLYLRNQARPHNTLAVKQLDELKEQLDILEKQHSAGTLNQAMVGPARDALNQTFRALLKLELEKKELDKKE